MIDQAVYSLLSTDAAIAALVGTRIYPIILPQTPTFPAITYTKVGAGRYVQHGGSVGVIDTTIQIDCYDTTILGAKNLAAAVVARCHALAGTYSTTKIFLASVINELDLSEPDFAEFRVMLEVMFTHN